MRIVVIANAVVACGSPPLAPPKAVTTESKFACEKAVRASAAAAGQPARAGDVKALAEAAVTSCTGAHEQNLAWARRLAAAGERPTTGR